ncbi:hypothetical protein [Nocardioides limicola]|uniref:hypothetical protein n=1 Tax=Nocardioides limicola TaxID=2803368 RepID=UPI00193C474A|nr:hypothetical protein [Nocardioides sp. DJM-14]
MSEFVRFISPGELGDVHAQCLREQGFEARSDGFSGYHLGDTPLERAGDLDAAVLLCERRYPLHPRYRRRRGESELRRLHQYLAETLTPALRQLGYLIGDPPEVSAFLTAGHNTWHPYNELPPLSESELSALLLAHPPYPPEWDEGHGEGS